MSLALSAMPGLGARLRTPVLVGFSAGFAASALWGLYLALSRAGVVSGLTGLDIAVLRFGVAGLVMLPMFLSRAMPLIRRIGWARAGLLAALAGPPFILAGVGGYAYAPLAHGALIQPATVTLGSVLLAWLVLKDRPGLARLVGVAVIMLGLAVIAGPGLLAGDALTPLGDAMFFVAGVMWAVFTILSKRWQVGPIEGTAVVSVLSAAALLPLVIAFGTFERILALPPAELAIQALVQGVLSGVVAIIAFTASVRALGASRAAIFPALVPVATILFGIPVAGEWPTALQVAGLAIVMAGLVLAAGLLAPRRGA